MKEHPIKVIISFVVVLFLFWGASLICKETNHNFIVVIIVVIVTIAAVCIIVDWTERN